MKTRITAPFEFVGWYGGAMGALSKKKDKLVIIVEDFRDVPFSNTEHLAGYKCFFLAYPGLNVIKSWNIPLPAHTDNLIQLRRVEKNEVIIKLKGHITNVHYLPSGKAYLGTVSTIWSVEPDQDNPRIKKVADFKNSIKDFVIAPKIEKGFAWDWKERCYIFDLGDGATVRYPKHDDVSCAAILSEDSIVVGRNDGSILIESLPSISRE